MNKHTLTLALFLLSCVVVMYTSCNHPQKAELKNPENSFSIKGSVHELNLYPDPPPEFPEHEGKAEFLSYCAICHSLKYITMQPNFSPKTWEAEVTKMIVKYHAPIDSANCKKITAYLVAIK